MSELHPAVLVVRGRAEALLGSHLLALATDTEAFANITKKPPAVLLAIARPGASVVLAIDASEYDALEVARMAGWDDAAPPSAMEVAQQRLTTSQ